MKNDIPPGDDICPVPPPVDEIPPFDRFCDIVLTGGVASGVVYPWAIVELARAYRFRNIGGTSVGAMAAALAAAAEYGRRTGFEAPFETLRRLPAALGEVLPDGRTRMLSLFQTAPRGRRLIDLWGRLGNGNRDVDKAGTGVEPKRPSLVANAIFEVAKVYEAPLWLGAFVGLWLVVVVDALYLHTFIGWRTWLPAFFIGLVASGIGALVGLVLALWGDIKHGLIGNDFGLCKGGSFEPPGEEGPRPALCEWLHVGIQRSAGLEVTDRPLTFRDLWSAPFYPGAPARPCTQADPLARRAINLQMITTNVTHGRPYRLPLADETSRLFFRREDLKDFLPVAVLDALVAASRPYVKCDNADPPPSGATQGFLELPGADLPVVVAARLSLSFPVLFSAVPLYAIDYENPDRAGRNLKRCWFTDGGVSSNFPIHLFDATVPRWPTFGLWLDRADPYRPTEAVWLPDFHRQGWGDNWNRFDPAAAAGAAAPAGSKPVPKDFWGFLLGLLSNAKDWRDRTSFRLPHVRNRVARLLLRPREGGLHIGMPREQILLMARRYGTAAGQLFVNRFVEKCGSESPAWREQRWVRLNLLINGLRERLSGLSASAAYAAHNLPIREEIAAATREAPLRDRGTNTRLNRGQADSLRDLLAELEHLEGVMQAAVQQEYQPIPEPELRLRAPL